VVPSFEVASVKLTSHGRTADGWSFSDVRIVSPGRLVATNASLDECIRWAYQLKEYQVSGPGWLNSDAASYDIEAKAPPETAPQQMRLMFQALLAERFKLTVHHETRTLSVYELVVAKSGPKLQEASSTARPGFSSQGGRGGVRMNAQKVTLAGFADWLSRNVERPVIDKNNLTCDFGFKLEWAREGDGPSVFTALQDQLGLKLQATKAPIEILVIDHAEKVPTEN